MTDKSVATVAGTIMAFGCLVLAGCAPTPTEGEPLPPDADTKTVDGPSPLLSLDCAGLIDLEAVQGVLGTVEAGTDPMRVAGGPWPLGHVGLAQLGALDCYWSDDAAPQREHPRYLSVTVLPDAAEYWANQESELSSWNSPLAGYGEQAFMNCGGGNDYQYCEYDVLVDGSWLHAEVKNIDSHDDAESIIRTLTDAVAGAEVVPPAWSPTGELPATCAEWLTAAEVATAVGTEGIAERAFPLFMPLILNESLGAGLACSWSNSYSSEHAMPLDVTALPGAGWAWDTAWAKTRPEYTPAEPLDSLGDQAFAGCQTEQNSCFVDVLVGDMWITTTGNKQAGIDGLAQLAEAAIAKLSP